MKKITHRLRKSDKEIFGNKLLKYINSNNYKSCCLSIIERTDPKYRTKKYYVTIEDYTQGNGFFCNPYKDQFFNTVEELEIFILGDFEKITKKDFEECEPYHIIKNIRQYFYN